MAAADAERLATTKPETAASASTPITIESEFAPSSRSSSSFPSTVKYASAFPSVELNPCSSTRRLASVPSTESRTSEPASLTFVNVARASPKTRTGNRPGDTYTVCCAVTFAAVNSTGVNTACPPSNSGCRAFTTPHSYQSSAVTLAFDESTRVAAESTRKKLPKTHVPSSLVAKGE